MPPSRRKQKIGVGPKKKMNGNFARSAYGVWLLTLASLAGLALSIFNYFWTGNGIHGTPGALLAVISSALMVLATIALMLWPDMPRWLHITLVVLIALDLAGTAFAAYMLDAYWVVGAMAAALVGWVLHLTADPSPHDVPAGALSS